jgi:hypothetical protein
VGRAQRGTVIAWHGLARTGRDMDELAASPEPAGWRVICPDTIGRGLSQWARTRTRIPAGVLRPHGRRPDGAARHRRALGGHLDGRRHRHGVRVRFSSLQLKGRIKRLLLNDNAPAWRPALERIKAYAGNPPAFDTMPSWRPFSGRSTSPTAGSATRSGAA